LDFLPLPHGHSWFLPIFTTGIDYPKGIETARRSSNARSGGPPSADARAPEANVRTMARLLLRLRPRVLVPAVETRELLQSRFVELARDCGREESCFVEERREAVLAAAATDLLPNQFERV
jgi:hypothetical protein